MHVWLQGLIAYCNSQPIFCPPGHDREDDDVCAAAGFEAHSQPLESARMALDEISHELAPSQWLEERSADKKPAQQLGTLGGGNHFLEVSPFLHLHLCLFLLFTCATAELFCFALLLCTAQHVVWALPLQLLNYIRFSWMLSLFGVHPHDAVLQSHLSCYK